jgi:hypothetical protein
VKEACDLLLAGSENAIFSSFRESISMSSMIMKDDFEV